MAALISLSLFQLLTTTRKSVRRITNVIDVDIPLMAFYNQIEKDVLGMFAPRSSVHAMAAKYKETKEKKPDEKSPKEEKKEQKPVPAVFVLDGKNDSLFLSFITTGALVLMDKDGALIPTPAMRRVAYLLERDPQRPGVMHLMYRFSDKELSAEALKNPAFSPSYELITGIKQLEIDSTLIEMVEKKEGSQAPQAKEIGKKGSSTTIKEWNEQEVWQKYKSLIPAYVRLKGSVVDLAGIEYPFDFLIKVVAYNPYKEQEKEQNIFQKLESLAEQIFNKKDKGKP